MLPAADGGMSSRREGGEAAGEEKGEAEEKLPERRAGSGDLLLAAAAKSPGRPLDLFRSGFCSV